MRRFILPLAAAGAFLAAAVPAAAQYYPAPGYGFRGNWGEVRALHMRIDNIRRQIDRFDRRDAIRGRSADRLMDEANKIDRRLRDKARNGLDAREAGDIQYRIQRLEQRVQWALAGRWDRFDRDWDHDRL